MKLMDEVLSKDNLNLAYSQVVRNKGAAGVDEMTKVVSINHNL